LWGSISAATDWHNNLSAKKEFFCHLESPFFGGKMIFLTNQRKEEKSKTSQVA
jgi:hypothetical protein